MFEQTRQLNNKKLNKRSFFHQYWYVLLLFFAFIVIAISTIIRIMTPAEIPIQDNSWGGITPGYSTIDQVVAQLGEPIDQENTVDGKRNYFKSDYPTLPNQVVSNSEGIVKFIKRYVSYDTEHTINQYVNKYGSADLELIDQETGDSFNAYVFLDQGIVVIAHIFDGTVNQIWYFEPTSKESFLSSWGNNLNDQVRGPEPMFDHSLLNTN